MDLQLTLMVQVSQVEQILDCIDDHKVYRLVLVYSLNMPPSITNQARVKEPFNRSFGSVRLTQPIFMQQSHLLFDTDICNLNSYSVQEQRINILSR
jgi:hypothetical protein